MPGFGRRGCIIFSVVMRAGYISTTRVFGKQAIHVVFGSLEGKLYICSIDCLEGTLYMRYSGVWEAPTHMHPLSGQLTVHIASFTSEARFA